MSFFDKLGSFGRKVWGAIQGLISPVSTAVEVGMEYDIPISPMEAYQELEYTHRMIDNEPLIASIPPDEYVPPNLYAQAEIPWNRPYAYEVGMYGYDLNTGEEVRVARVITSSDEMTIEEITGVALARFAAGGDYPQIDVLSVGVTGAEVRRGEVR